MVMPTPTVRGHLGAEAGSISTLVIHPSSELAATQALSLVTRALREINTYARDVINAGGWPDRIECDFARARSVVHRGDGTSAWSRVIDGALVRMLDAIARQGRETMRLFPLLGMQLAAEVGFEVLFNRPSESVRPDILYVARVAVCQVPEYAPGYAPTGADVFQTAVELDPMQEPELLRQHMAAAIELMQRFPARSSGPYWRIDFFAGDDVTSVLVRASSEEQAAALGRDYAAVTNLLNLNRNRTTKTFPPQLL